MKKFQDNVGALIDPSCCIEGNATGTLTGKTFVLKDIFDVKGYPTGFGNPGWKETHPIASDTNTSVSKLLNNGASLLLSLIHI